MIAGNGDTSHGPILTIDGKKVQTYLIQLIDDASRLIVGYEFFLNDNAINFQLVLKQAIKTYGVPKKIFVDNRNAIQKSTAKINMCNTWNSTYSCKSLFPRIKSKNRKII